MFIWPTLGANLWFQTAIRTRTLVTHDRPEVASHPQRHPHVPCTLALSTPPMAAASPSIPLATITSSHPQSVDQLTHLPRPAAVFDVEPLSRYLRVSHHGLTAATPVGNPCCSCKLTRVRSGYLQRIGSLPGDTPTAAAAQVSPRGLQPQQSLWRTPTAAVG